MLFRSRDDKYAGPLKYKRDNKPARLSSLLKRGQLIGLYFITILLSLYSISLNILAFLLYRFWALPSLQSICRQKGKNILKKSRSRSAALSRPAAGKTMADADVPGTPLQVQKTASKYFKIFQMSMNMISRCSN